MTSNVVAHVLRDTFSTEEWAPHGCGGVWRRRQIDGILRRHGVEPVNPELPPPASLPARLLRKLRLKGRLGTSIQWKRRSLGQAEYSYRFYGHNARRPRLARVALLESGADLVAFAALKDAGFRVIAALNAINSLWLSRPSSLAGPYPLMFHAETRALSSADAVFCISREEQWLLNNLGIAANYLPYFPDEERARALMAERDTRPPLSTSGPREFLICATRNNTDTVSAFREQAEWICKAVPEGNALFNVTGHQTEEIKDIWADNRFVFQGTCSDEKFRTVKQRCVAICLHQRQGLGALTRIPDMILSGLSVLANGPAARSFIEMAGVHVYDTPGKFRELLQAAIPLPPLPHRPVDLEDAFFLSLQLK
jgi:hypothetical protein